MSDATIKRLLQCRERIAKEFNKIHTIFRTCHDQEDRDGFLLLFKVVDNLYDNFQQLYEFIMLDMTDKGYAQFTTMSADDLANLPILGQEKETA